MLVTDHSGANVLDATIPGGPYTLITKIGWTLNAAGTKAVYRNPGTMPLISGIYKIVLRTTKIPGELKFNVLGKTGSYPVSLLNIPVKATLVIDSPVATGGQCGEALWPGPAPNPSCFLTARGTLRCK